MATQSTHTQDEIDWVLSDGSRRDILNSFSPELLASFKRSNKTSLLKPNQPKYNIAELATQSTHTQDEIDWVLRDGKRRKSLRELAPELIATFKKSTNN